MGRRAGARRGGPAGSDLLRPAGRAELDGLRHRHDRDPSRPRPATASDVPPGRVDPFPYERAPVRVTNHTESETESYAVRLLRFPSSGENGQEGNTVTARYYESIEPGPRPLVVVLPIWGGHTVSTGHRDLRSRGPEAVQRDAGPRRGLGHGLGRAGAGADSRRVPVRVPADGRARARHRGRPAPAAGLGGDASRRRRAARRPDRVQRKRRPGRQGPWRATRELPPPSC